MNSMYTEPELTERYLHLSELSLIDIQSQKQSGIESAYESFYRSLIEQMYASLQYVSPRPLPELRLHVSHGESGLLACIDAEATYIDVQGIHVGLSFVTKLDAAILVLSAYLMENYLWQVSPLVLDMQSREPSDPYDNLMPLSMYAGRLPSISEVVGLTCFPAEALSLYSAHLIPEAEACDGYQKRPSQLIMEHLQEARLAGRSDANIGAVARAFPKPIVDFTDFCSRFDPGVTLQAYQDPDTGPYLLKLHLQLLLDGLYFVLAHENAHHQLGHLHSRGEAIANLRQDEAAADAAALALLNGIPGFQPRSLIIIFNYASDREREVPPDRMDHPLARNRLLILADTLLAGSGGEGLCADINAGLALMPSRLEPKYLTFGWPNEDPEDVNIHISSYSDMDYTAHFMVYIDRPPRHVEPEEGFKQNAFLLAHLAYKIWFEVRDRIDSERVYASGGAGYHPTIRPSDLFSSNRSETVFSRLHLSIPAPPEFCLKWPGAEFVVKRIEILYRTPHIKRQEEGPNPIRFFYGPVEIELNEFLQGLPPLGWDRILRSRLLLAARRYLDYDRGDASIQIYQWLYRQSPESLPYGDLVRMANQLVNSGRLVEAAEIARWAVGAGRVQRPGFHYILALYHDQREEKQEAYEEAFLEMGLFGMYGEMFGDAQETCARITSYAVDPVVDTLRTFMTYRDAAGQALQHGEHDDALAKFRAGKNELLAGQSQALRDFVFLRQLLSDITLAISELEGKGFEAAAKAAQAVLALRPDFVLALMNLASIALLDDNRKAAYGLWEQAHAIAPFHNIVFDRREEFERGLS